MHGLPQIKSQNEIAAREYLTAQLTNERAHGRSYYIKKDTVTGEIDINAELFSYQTAAQMKANLLATVNSSHIDQYHIYYGSN